MGFQFNKSLCLSIEPPCTLILCWSLKHQMPLDLSNDLAEYMQNPWEQVNIWTDPVTMVGFPLPLVSTSLFSSLSTVQPSPLCGPLYRFLPSTFGEDHDLLKQIESISLTTSSLCKCIVEVVSISDNYVMWFPLWATLKKPNCRFIKCKSEESSLAREWHSIE